MSSPSKANPAPQSASLSDWLSWLESFHPKGIDLGLDRVLMVYRRLFRRAPKGRKIVVAGTNGKGSTVTAIDALLRASGRTTGAYTSPHIHRYNERIAINGVAVDDATIVAAFEAVNAARGNVSLTYFEFGTLAAFYCFAQAGVDDWVLEVGLGGRLDAVNVVDADLAIITAVDLDHMDWLGPDRESVGYEKAGILRHGRPAVCADPEPPASVLQQASAQKVALIRLGVDFSVSTGDASTGPTPVVRSQSLGRTVRLPASSLPVTSLATAVQAIWMLEPAVADEKLAQALQTLRLAGRWEQLASEPTIVCDVGHNPHAARWLAQRLEALKAAAPGKISVLAVYGALADKDSPGVAAALANVVDQWFLAGLDHIPRGLSDQALKERLAEPLLGKDVQIGGSVAKALDAARQAARAEDVIIAFGSFFLVAEARDALASFS